MQMGLPTNVVRVQNTQCMQTYERIHCVRTFSHLIPINLKQVEEYPVPSVYLRDSEK